MTFTFKLEQADGTPADPPGQATCPIVEEGGAH